MTNQHRAYAALDNRAVGGYSIQISLADENIVHGELVNTSRTPLPFTIKALESQFDVPEVQQDILREFAQHIHNEGLAPVGSVNHLKLNY